MIFDAQDEVKGLKADCVPVPKTLEVNSEWFGEDGKCGTFRNYDVIATIYLVSSYHSVPTYCETVTVMTLACTNDSALLKSF